MRPAAGDRAEVTGNWFHSVDSEIQDARQPAGVPNPGPAGEPGIRIRAQRPEAPGIRPVSLASFLLPKWVHPPPGAWVPHFYSNPNTMGGGQPPMSSILAPQPGPTGIPFSHPPHTAGPPIWGFILSYTGHEWPPTCYSLDAADFAVHGDAQPVTSSMPIPLSYMSPYPYPPPFLSSAVCCAPAWSESCELG